MSGSNEIDDARLIEAAERELLSPVCASTIQYLRVLDVERVDGRIDVARIDRDSSGKWASIWVRVAKARFWLGVQLELEPALRPCWTNTIATCRTYLKVTSEAHSLDELRAMTRLEIRDGWNRGDRRPGSNAVRPFTRATIEPESGYGEFEDRMARLLDVLESDRDGIKRWVDAARCEVVVPWYAHNGNGSLGGFSIDRRTAARLAELSLGIDFDLYAEGVPFLED